MHTGSKRSRRAAGLSDPTVSIVVPTFKSAGHLRRMIESVRAQTLEDWELIIVDGKSNDGTAELVREYEQRLGDRLIFIEQTNQGCCVARNTGIEAARGGFVAFLDSDDEFRPAKLSRQMELFRLRPDHRRNRPAGGVVRRHPLSRTRHVRLRMDVLPGDHAPVSGGVR